MVVKNRKVWIVGVGPGDPELLTLKALRILQDEAEVVVYDRLVPDEILELIPNKVERVYAGKSCKKHVMTQDEINQELLKHYKEGKKTVRLKGGDPFIFGRGGEEMLYLAEHDVSFEIIPGITTANSIAAEFGVPLTHRGIATSVSFITGHKQRDKPISFNWDALANADNTIVIYMGLANISYICNNLIKHGMEEEMPCLAVHWSSTKDRKILKTKMKDFVKNLELEKFQAPTTIVIGKVVDLMK